MAYPLGVIGVILAVLLIRKLLVRREDLEVQEKDDANKTYIAAFQVHNPAIFNKSINGNDGKSLRFEMTTAGVLRFNHTSEYTTSHGKEFSTSFTYLTSD